ncbi:tetratricopeptide repeat protein [Paenibacillus cymbidii]|uniref:tetratricopeptide repeat protein n=1 Tax=Paenibacillus cymbidii TaxID=1639034 RepID=UPI001080945D|nr:tetratricopeptide repeat protein [Paenibacillus cymbidii]
MSKGIKRLLIGVAVLVVVVYLFTVHWLLGVAAIVLGIGWAYYRRRDAVYTQRANAALMKGNVQEALAHLETAYRLNPNNMNTAMGFGYQLLKAGQVERADEVLGALLAAAKDESDKSRIRMNVALVRWKQGKLDEAIAMLEGIHEKMKTTVLYGSLGYLYIERGDLDQALAYNREAFEYNDSDAVIVDNWCLTNIRRGEWQQALEAADKLAALKPKFPEAYYHIGLVRKHQGDPAGALELFETALGKPFTAVSTESRETIERERDELAEAARAGEAEMAK